MLRVVDNIDMQGSRRVHFNRSGKTASARLLGSLAAAALGFGLLSAPAASAASAYSGAEIVARAASQAGLPYCWAGGNQSGPTHGEGNVKGASHCGSGVAGFDCTGLTMFATGLPLAHDSAQAIDAVNSFGGQRIYHESELQPGDLVYFGGSFEAFDHVGVYAGGGMMWDADIAYWIYPDGVHERTLKSVENELAFKGGVRLWHEGGPGPLEITTSTLPVGRPGGPYSVSLGAAGGSGSYTWSLSGGTLQAGLTLTPSGVVSGTPKLPGAATLTVTVTDREGHARSESLDLMIGEPPEELFGRGSDGNVWHDYLFSSGAWSGWGSLGGLSSAGPVSDVAAGYNQFGNKELFVVGSDGNVWHNYLTPSAGWSGWGSLGGLPGAHPASGVAVGYNQFGNEELFVVGSDGNVWHNYLAPSAGWSGWGSLGGLPGAHPASGVAVGYNQFGNEELFVVGSDGNVWHNYLAPSAGWSGWGSLGGLPGAHPASGVAVGYNQFGNEELFVVGSDGNVWHNYLAPSAGWSGWGSLGGPSGATLISDVATSDSPSLLGLFSEQTAGQEVVGGSDSSVVGSDSSRSATARVVVSGSGVHCLVPGLHGMTIHRARRLVARAHCALGRVGRPRHVPRRRELRIAGQSVKRGSRLPAGYRIDVRLAVSKGRKADR